MKDYKKALDVLLSIYHLPIRSGKTMLKDSIECMKELVEKATPKKPHLQGDGYDPSGNIVLDTWICPNCEEYYEVGYDDYDFCPKCGQALNMMEVREENNNDQ